MKIFTTGGTGFIGSHFVQAAITSGHEVIALRRPGSQPRILLKEQPKWIDGALDDVNINIFTDIDIFVHLASHTPNPPYAPLDECLYWNVYAPLLLARKALASGTRRFIVAGTCFEYGDMATNNTLLTATTPLQPTLSYPTSKAAASIAFEGFAREHQVKLKILRIFQAYGEGEQANRFWPAMRTAALAGVDFPMSPGEQIRDFINAVDVAQQFVSALDFSEDSRENSTIHHIASGHPQMLKDFATMWWQRWRARGKLQLGALPYRKGEPMIIASDSGSLLLAPHQRLNGLFRSR